MAAAALGLIGFVASAYAEPAIGGQIMDRNGQPVQKAMVSLEPGGIELVTDREGRFTITYLRDGQGERVKLTKRTDYVLQVIKPGFHSQSIDVQYVRGVLLLEPVMLVAETIAVTDDRADLDPGAGPITETNGHSLEGY